MQIAHQDVLPFERLVGAVRVRYPHEEEVGFGREHLDRGHPGKRAGELAAVPENPRGLLFKDLETLEDIERGGLRQHVEVVRLAHLVELADPFGARGEVAEADPGKTELRRSEEHTS